MLSLVLMLTTQGAISPGNFELERRYESGPAYGARLTRDHANTIGEGMLLAQAGEPPPIPPPGGELAAPMPARSLQDLRAEYARLSDSRPGLVGPIVMLGIGVVALAIGLPIFYYLGVFNLIYGGLSNLVLAMVGIVFGGALIIAGVVLAIVGGVKLGRTIRDRSQIGRQMEEIKAQIDALESAPPPPPPPSSVERNGHAPLPGLAVLEF